MLQKLIDRVGGDVRLDEDALAGGCFGVPMMNGRFLHLVPCDERNVLLVRPGPHPGGLVRIVENLRHSYHPGSVVGQ